MHVFHRLRDTLPVSHLFLALFAEAVQADPEQSLGELVRTLYAEVYQRFLEEDELHAVCERLHGHGQAVKQRAEATGNKRKPSTTKRGFGQYYTDFIHKLDTSQACLWLSDFDVVRARQMYEREDHEIVDAMLQLRIGVEHERNRLLFEGALFGFGGQYGSSGPRGIDEGEVRVHDYSDMSSDEALKRLQQMGRRH